MKIAVFTFGGVIAAILLGLWMTVVGPTRLPPGKEAYAGTWLADGVALTITPGSVLHDKRQRIPRAGEAEGTFSYTTSETNLRIVQMDADGFTAGRLLLASHYVVNRPPTKVGGEWKMTVDGIELTRNPDPTDDSTLSVGVHCVSDASALNCDATRRGLREAFTTCFDVKLLCPQGPKTLRACLRATEQAVQPEKFPFSMFQGPGECHGPVDFEFSNMDLRSY
jgi:hypothetical protein